MNKLILTANFFASIYLMEQDYPRNIQSIILIIMIINVILLIITLKKDMKKLLILLVLITFGCTTEEVIKERECNCYVITYRRPLQFGAEFERRNKSELYSNNCYDDGHITSHTSGQGWEFKYLFNFPKNTVVKTNEKLNAKASKKIDTKDLMLEFDGFPNKKQYFAIKTNGTSYCGSIFTYALQEWEEITEMYLATWTISKQNIKKLKNLTMVFSSTLKGANPALYASLVGSLKNFENVKLKEINSHAKTFSISNGKEFITVSGSANWSENPRIENFLILNDK